MIGPPNLERPRPLHGARRRRFGPAPAAALLAARLAAGAPLPEVPLDGLRGALESSTPVSRTARGLEIEVFGQGALALPLRATREIEIDGIADGFFTVTWAPESGIGVPPWRYERVRPGPVRLRLDLMQSLAWNPSARPVLVFEGTGRFVVSRVRAGAAPTTWSSAQEAWNRTVFWAPESIGHTTINSLTPPLWSAADRGFFSTLLAGAFCAVAVATLAAVFAARRAWRPGLALAVAAGTAIAIHDAHFLARLLPALDLAFEPDPEERIRNGYPFAAEFGELAARARAELGPGERVGTMAHPKDWFTAQTLCFNLAPRPCAIVGRGEEHAGISGITRLRSDELDAIVSFGAIDALPDGFAPVAFVSRRAFVARRR